MTETVREEESPLLSTFKAKLAERIADPEELESAERVAEAVVKALEKPNATPDEIKGVAIAALGDALEEAEAAIVAAEKELQ